MAVKEDEMTGEIIPFESPIRKWFENNFHLLGYDEILESRSGREGSPDFTMRVNEEKRGVEIESILSNFLRHAHNPCNVGDVVCMFRDISFDPLEPRKYGYKIGGTSDFQSRRIMADREGTIEAYKEHHCNWVPELRKLKVIVLDEQDFEGVDKIRRRLRGDKNA